MLDSILSHVKKVRSQAPLVHNITNYVVMNNTANALLAVGASPVMAHAEEEVEDMVAIASSLVINIGTLSPTWVNAMKKAMHRAKEMGKPIVLDPVGAGATPYRNEVLKDLLKVASPSVIRGNASEIMALVATHRKTKGVDSTDSSADAVEAGKQLSQDFGSVICISGAVDILLSGNREVRLSNGHPLMAKVTGMGCTATAILGAFCGVSDTYHEAATAAMAVMGVVGEIASERSAGPGSMQMNFLDTLHTFTEADIQNRIKLHHV